jgi:crotonobetainyl-CoA:carnitine CoA-transferase CaiB-like acyl-CoA transferase
MLFNMLCRSDPEVPVADRPPPTLGAHTREVLNDLGFDEGQIAALQAQGVI